MKEFSIFSFKSYKAYLRDWIRARPSRGRGEKRRLAEKAGCHSAYISQVLEHGSHFSLEQAIAINAYLGHSEVESRYFILLVQFERAGTNTLREHFERQLNEIIERRISLQHQLERKGELSAEDQAIYYSSWHYAAIQVIVLIPHCRTKERIANKLRISIQRISEVLEFLVSKRLVTQNNGEYSYGPIQMHLPQTSPLSAKMHANWRMRALDSFDHEQRHDLHFSSVAAIREDDLGRIRNIFMKAIEDVGGVIHGSTSEDTLFCYGIDVFRP